MARPLRIQYPGAYYHVTSRGNERKAIFKSDRDRERFLIYLATATERYQAVIHVYCLMNNHFHILLETPAGNLSRIMRHINGAYTTYFNTKHKRSGHLFQGRYKAYLIDGDSYATELSRYIHLNPVRAGIVEKPEQYQWSSYAAYIGKTKPPAWLKCGFILGYMGEKDLNARKQYRSFVNKMIKEEHYNPLDGVYAATILGDENFIQEVKDRHLQGREEERDIPAIGKMIERPGIPVIIKAVDDRFGMDRYLSKRIALYVSHRYSGKPLREIGSHFGIGESAVSQASRRLGRQILEDKGLFQEIEIIVEKIKSKV
ncbi:MAG: REP-associated tyrosine transposase [Thermodesulfobacteriota bacterium]